MRNNGVEE